MSICINVITMATIMIDKYYYNYSDYTYFIAFVIALEVLNAEP